MTDVDALVEFLNARIADDDKTARDAIDPDRPGSHWQWVACDTDVPVTSGTMDDAIAHQSVSLRSVEEFPTRSGVGALPAFVIHQVDEFEPHAAADHIARWDPARVLAECDAKRELMKMHAEKEYATVLIRDYPHADPEGGNDGWGVLETCAHCSWHELYEGFNNHDEPFPCPTLRLIALPYADHKDWREEWRP